MPKFVRGQSGNPGGRRKQSQAAVDLLAVLRRQLAERAAEGLGTHAERLVQGLLAAAEGGDVNAAREIWNRVHGRVPVAEPPSTIDLEFVASVMMKRRAEMDGESLSTVVPKPNAVSQARPPSPPKCGLIELPEELSVVGSQLSENSTDNRAPDRGEPLERSESTQPTALPTTAAPEPPAVATIPSTTIPDPPAAPATVIDHRPTLSFGDFTFYVQE